jgi:hypothetical protein
LQCGVKQIVHAVAASATKSLTEIHAGMLHPAETFVAIKMAPSAARHPDAQDVAAAHRASPPEGSLRFSLVAR